MAIVKNNYVKRGRGQIDRVKASLRYITHRPGKDNERMYRELFAGQARRSLGKGMFIPEEVFRAI